MPADFCCQTRFSSIDAGLRRLDIPANLQEQVTRHLMQAVLIIIHLLVAVSLIFVVLLQRSEGGALGMGGAAPALGGLFSPRGAASTLTRTTAILGLVFFITSMSLTIVIAGREAADLDSQPSAPGTAAPRISTLRPLCPPALPGRHDASECKPGCPRCARASRCPADSLSRHSAEIFPE